MGVAGYQPFVMTFEEGEALKMESMMSTHGCLSVTWAVIWETMASHISGSSSAPPPPHLCATPPNFVLYNLCSRIRSLVGGTPVPQLRGEPVLDLHLCVTQSTEPWNSWLYVTSAGKV